MALPYGRGFTLTRTQFPLRLAYCLTINKSQSQTFDQVVLDLRVEPFSHGHLYVACSRVRLASNFLIVCSPDQSLDGVVAATNVVFPKLLIPDEEFFVKPQEESEILPTPSVAEIDSIGLDNGVVLSYP